MKNWKKTLAWMLLTAMPMTAAAQAEAIERAASPVEMRSFERYPSHTYDEATGKWIVRANPADALLDRFWTYVETNSTAMCAFIVEIEGNAYTGVRTPVLRAYYQGSKALNARAVCILADGVRYDLAATSAEVVNDEGDDAELISAPLNAESLQVIRAMMNAENVQIRLMGDQVYTAELDPETTNSRRRIEAASLNGLDAAAQILDEAGMNDYALWDLSAAAWRSEYGFAPAFAKNEVTNVIGETEIKDEFGMVVRGDQNSAVKAAQEILIEAGFLSGSATTTFGENTTAAVQRAQKYLGMVETGGMDAALADALKSGVCAEEEEAAVEWQNLGEVAQVGLNRYWFADGVSAQNDPASMQTVLNGDNVLLAADGMIRNISAQELRLFTGVEAKVIYGGSYEYEATVLCESDEGAALDMTMLPMAQARLVVYAEVPAYLAEEEGAAWSIRLSAGDAVLEYGLQ